MYCVLGSSTHSCVRPMWAHECMQVVQHSGDEREKGMSYMQPAIDNGNRSVLALVASVCVQMKLSVIEKIVLYSAVEMMNIVEPYLTQYL
mmetsp:Transcript_26245/g.37476  ORF Transcript_26245/g.37476 Transcript_26245/m.37476 type:complete len:90 (+) Transcript_26245:1221-1490(+)